MQYYFLKKIFTLVYLVLTSVTSPVIRDTMIPEIMYASKLPFGVRSEIRNIWPKSAAVGQPCNRQDKNHFDYGKYHPYCNSISIFLYDTNLKIYAINIDILEVNGPRCAQLTSLSFLY